MSGSDAKFLRKFLLWAGVTSPQLQRHRRDAWERMSHKERGRAKAKIEAAMSRDPAPPFKPPRTGDAARTMVIDSSVQQ